MLRRFALIALVLVATLCYVDARLRWEGQSCNKLNKCARGLVCVGRPGRQWCDEYEEPDTPDRYERPDTPDRYERPDTPDRYERPDREDRFERPDRPDREDRYVRPYRYVRGG